MCRADKRASLAKAIRVITTAPVLVCLLCVLLYAGRPQAFASPSHALAAVFFLTALPLLAYPLAAAMACCLCFV